MLSDDETKTTWKPITDSVEVARPITEVIFLIEEHRLLGFETLKDFQFVFALAFRCLELEAGEAVSPTATQQVAYLLDRLEVVQAAMRAQLVSSVSGE